MDKSWMKLQRYDPRYFDGINNFIDFVRQNRPETMHLCPCTRCRLHHRKLTLDEMYAHLIQNGMMMDYTTWTSHGELRTDPSILMLRQQYIMEKSQGTMSHNSCCDTCPTNPTMDILNDAFPFRDMHQLTDVVDDSLGKDAYEKYTQLLLEAQTPIFAGSNKSVLDTVLKVMQMKVDNGWSDKSCTDQLRWFKEFLPSDNKFPGSYRDVRRSLKNLGLGYETIHACEYGCILYYKENKDLDYCPVCHESRYVCVEGTSRTPRRVVRYFPLTPRLQRLYMSETIAKEMRWHGERRVKEGQIRHPADGEEWQDFNKEFPEFASEIRNVRLGLATDGFNPFGSLGVSHSTWPIMLMPYNLPPSMCMKKEFNLLTLLISGPKSPGKCLNVFMRPLIEELKMLWDTGVITYDKYDGSSFCMKAAVMSTISDFPGLGMLGGMKTKGYKACPICLDDVDAEHLSGRMVYQGHRRWLDTDHRWRQAADKFDGTVESRNPPPSLYGHEIMDNIFSHEFPVLSLHPNFKACRSGLEKLCWTHQTIFFELPYWKYLRQPYSLDVMHIEKNVFDNIIGTVLGIDGKTKDTPKAREGLKQQGVRENLWEKEPGPSLKKTKVSQAPYTVLPDCRKEIFEWIRAAKYPAGYAGSLKNKISVTDKKFNGLKTHDCHVMMQRLLPVVIRPYLPYSIVEPIIALSRWFQKLCCRELRKDDVCQMKDDIVLILCKLEMIFPPAFFTIMVHLLIHLPKQVLLKGPVHYNWMFPIERQLGQYKKSVRNARYPEGSITEQYVLTECVVYCKLYVDGSMNLSLANKGTSFESQFKCSVVSDLVKPIAYMRKFKLDKQQLEIAHQCVMEHCKEAKYYIDKHVEKYYKKFPNGTNEARKKNFHSYFFKWILDLHKQNSKHYSPVLHILARLPQTHTCYSQCYVNGVKFVVWERDRKLKTQNSGLMVESEDMTYYGIVENVIELKYADGLPVVLFQCRWFNTDPKERGSTRIDHGLLSVDTSTSWYEDEPFCLASTARQVFYLDDPKEGEPWKVVNVVTHNGIYSESSLARDESGLLLSHVAEPYQEDVPANIISGNTPISGIDIDLGSLPREFQHERMMANDVLEDDGSTEDGGMYGSSSEEDEYDTSEGESEGEDDASFGHP